MRDDWELKTLEYGFMKDSSNLSINKLNDDDGNYPFYSAKGFVKNVSFYHQEKSYLAIIKDGAGVGRVSLHPAKSSVVGTLQYLLPKEGFDLKFLYYYLLSVDFSKHFTGSTIPHIYFKDYKSEPFPVLALNEQKEIVEILDQAFESIKKAKANIEKNIENVKELFQSKLNQIFFPTVDDWTIKELNEICENLDSKRIPITKNKREPGEVPYYGASGIVDYVEGYLFDEELLLVSEDGANLLARTYPIAFSVNGKTWVNNHAHVLRFKNISTQFFIEYYLNSIKLDDYISGMAQPKLNQTKLNSILVPYPKLSKQKEIVETLDILDNHIQSILLAYKEKLVNLEELKKSILQKAFSGELTNKNKAA